MKVVDARTGKCVNLSCSMRPWFSTVPIYFGEGAAPVFDYGDGERTVLRAVKPGLLRSFGCLESTYRDHRTGQLVTSKSEVELPTRWMHPGFPFQWVAFIPS